jgi:hypothetical protein
MQECSTTQRHIASHIALKSGTTTRSCLGRNIEDGHVKHRDKIVICDTSDIHPKGTVTVQSAPHNKKPL